LTGSPAVSSWEPGRLDVFVPGAGAKIYHRVYTNDRWYNWEDLGGGVRAESGPAAVSWGPNRIDLFIRGTDDALWHRVWTGSAWSAWELLGGVLTGSPAVSSWQGGRLDVFVPGLGSRVYHRFYQPNQWSNWEDLGGGVGVPGGIGAVSGERDRIDYFVSGTDNQLWHRIWTTPNWGGPGPLGGQTAGGPAASTFGSMQYTTSAWYGGPNHIVDTDAEVQGVVTAMNAAGGGQELWNRLSPTDQSTVEQRSLRDQAVEVEELDAEQSPPAPDAEGTAAIAAGGRCPEITNRRSRKNKFGQTVFQIRLRTQWCYVGGQVRKMYPAGTYCNVASFAAVIGMYCGATAKYRANCYGGNPERCAWTYTYEIRFKVPTHAVDTITDFWCATNQVRGDGRHYRHGSCDLRAWSGPQYGG
jgi:hypothetical protein